MKKFSQAKICLLAFWLLSLLAASVSFSAETSDQPEVWFPDFIVIAKGSDYSIGLKSDGMVFGWGSNAHGQLGAGPAVVIPNSESPTKTGDVRVSKLISPANPVEMQTATGPLTQVTEIACDHEVSYALRADGTVWSAGETPFSVATQLVGISDITSFSMRHGRLLFGKGDGSFYQTDGTRYEEKNEFAQSSGEIFQNALLSLSSPTSQVAPEEPFSLSLSAVGPFYAPANVVLVTSLTHPANRTITKVDFYYGGVCFATATAPPYQWTINNLAKGLYLIEAVAYDSTGGVTTATTQFEVKSGDCYERGFGNDQNYHSSIIAVDHQYGMDLDGSVDFSQLYGTNYPWFLRVASDAHGACFYINHEVAADGKIIDLYSQINVLPVINGATVGGEPPMVAFGSRSENGTPLYVNQDYHFGIIPGCINVGALKIDVYEKEAFKNGATNVAPVVTKIYNLPFCSENFSDLAASGSCDQDYHLITNVNGKLVDFDTQMEYQTGNFEVAWGNSFATPFLLTHRSANDLFFYKVSVKGYAPLDGDFTKLIPMAKMDYGNGGLEGAYNLSYTLDFQKRASWSSLTLNRPQFQGAFLPSDYQGKNIDELIHQAPAVKDNLPLPDQTTWAKYTTLDNSPELKTHPILDKLASDLQNDPLAIANYVQNEIELTDGIGYNVTGNVDPVSINCQGVTRDALATYLEGQGSPVEQCALLIYLLRKAGVPAAYVFPDENGTHMFDEQLSKLLHVQLRGAVGLIAHSAQLPELIPINYPWVAAYIHGEWVHLFPWLKDTAVTEGLNLWDYFPNGYKTGTEWTLHYLLNDPSIRLLSKQDNPGTLFPLYAQEQLKKKKLTLDDVGMRFLNRSHCYADWSQFPRPWVTPVVNNSNLAQNLSADQNSPALADQLRNIFDTIDITVVSDRNGQGISDSNNPLLKTGPLRFADLHDRRLLLYHQIIPGTTPAQYNMILSLEPYDSTSGSSALETHTFLQGSNADPGDLRSPQKISAVLDSTKDDAIEYQISCRHHQQADRANRHYNAQFPCLYEADDATTDTCFLRKGDMAALSLDYGRVTQKMKDVELEKYLNYQRLLQADPTISPDPELATGQLLQLMGKTYYYHVGDFQQKIEDLTKVHSVSFRAHGLSKFSPERDQNGPVTTTNNGVLDFNLLYPRVDMSFQQAVSMGNRSDDATSGNNAHENSQTMQLITAEASAQEHCVLNEFFNQRNAVSTVRLLDLAQGWTPETGVAAHPGSGVSILHSDNYSAEEAQSLRTYSQLNNITGFETMWGQIRSFFENNDPDSFPIAIVTPKPETATGQDGFPYTGMAAFTLSLFGDGAYITDRMNPSLDHGGYAGSIDEPISSSWPDFINNVIVPVATGGFALIQNSSEDNGFNFNSDDSWLNYLPAVNAPQNFNTVKDQLITGNQVLTPDAISDLGLWNNAVSQTIGGDYQKIPLLPDKGLQVATDWSTQQNIGNIGSVSFYGKLINHVMDPVSVITGEFYINALDIKLNGPMPLEIHRSYGSQNQADNNFGHGWKLSCFPYLMLSTAAESDGTPSLIYAAEADGSVVAYRYQPSQQNWAPRAADNPDLINASDGTTITSCNLFNNRIVSSVAGDGSLNYSLKGSDGSERLFKTTSFPCGGSADIRRTRPYLNSWTDAQGNVTHFYFGTNNMANDWGQLNAIIASNGASLHLNYDPYNHITEIFSSDGRYLKYNYDGYGDLSQVTLPDGSKINYSYQHSSTPSSTATNASSSSGVAPTTYSTHLLTKEIKPDGRILKNHYDAQRRVVTQSSTVGTSPGLVQNAAFHYNITGTNADNTMNGTTDVIDVNGKKTSYRIASSQIVQIDYPNQTAVTQTWDPVSHSLTSHTDRRGLVTSFSYDTQGNLTSRTLSGNITGKGSSDKASTTMSYNNLNELTSITDPLGNKTTYDYKDSAHPYEPSTITKTAGGSSMQLSYGAYGLLASQRITANNTTAAETDYSYNGQGFLTSITQKTGTSDADITTQVSCNQRGEIVSETDMSGAKKNYDYDAMGRRISTEVTDANGSLIDWHFNYYNANGEISWEQGARFNPTDKTYYDYDWAGRLHHKIVWLSAACSDGSCVKDGGVATTTYDHDAYGNITKITDAMGHCTSMSYDEVGQMLTRCTGNAKDNKVSETFSYEPGGLVASHINVLGGTEKNSYTSTGLLQSTTQADGTTTSYLYDLIGRIVQKTFPSGMICNTSYDDATGILSRSYLDANGASLGVENETHDAYGHIVTWTDRVGNQFARSFDALGRVKKITGPSGSTGSEAQSLSYAYDPKNKSEIIVNALGETMTGFYDALGRPLQVTLVNSDGSVAKKSFYWYSADHQSVVTWEGSDNNAIINTTFTDLQNRPIILSHNDGSSQITGFDAIGNKIGFCDEVGAITTWSYDNLGHLASETLPGGGTINYSYNAAGELLARAMPGGLTEKNNYNQAGQKTSDELEGNDGSITRSHQYSYANGVVSSITDPRGFMTTINSDGFGRPLKVTSSGSSTPEQNQTTTYTYDPRGLLTSIVQGYAEASTGPQTEVARSYDAYGQLLSETSSINGTNVAAWKQSWNEAGRRTALNWTLDNQGSHYQFGYNALGLMTSVANASGLCHYTYGDNGLLSQRQTPFSTTTINRNDRGEITTQVAGQGNSCLLSENIGWRKDGKIDNYNVLDNLLDMPHEARNYAYDARGRLAQEPYALSNANTNIVANGTQMAEYCFDEDLSNRGGHVDNGLGVRTLQFVNNNLFNAAMQQNSFAQVLSDAAENGNGIVWQNSYDPAGEMTSRSVEGGVQQGLTWDAFGRLVSIDQRNNVGNGFHWKTIYDGLGRRLQSSYSDLGSNQNAAAPLCLSYYNDPEVEFLELGHDYFGRTWNLYGPDRSGFYGGAQGIGGLELTEASAIVSGSVNNYFGDRLASLTTVGLYSYGSVLGGYGAMPGSSVNADLVPQWRGHYLDWTGFYYMGARYYEPNSGRFLSADPLGHDASLSLYDYCGGDPVNGLDPDGRCKNPSTDRVDIAAQMASVFYPALIYGEPINDFRLGLPDYIGRNKVTPPDTTHLIIDYNVPSDAVTYWAANGEAFYAPPNADFQNVYNTGKANGPLNYFGAVYAVGSYGKFDYQRNQGQGDLRPMQNNIFYPAYTDASNYAVGAYMKGAGLALFATDIAGIVYAAFHKNPNPLSSTLKQWWSNGWNTVNAEIPNRVYSK